jgi:8-amino-7-oxononanoate synthase
MNNRYAWMEQELSSLAEQSLERSLATAETSAADGGKWIERSGRRLLNLSSNNYLGLAGDPRIAEAACRAAERWGAGATASRLVVGNHALYGELEERLANWKQRDAALVFANGYMANMGTIAALVGRGDAVFSDRLNHASIVDGILLSRAEHYRYRHNDVEHLEYLLKKHDDHRRKLIVTDTVFSMDGDFAPLARLVELRDRYGALLMVDEAHAGGVRGKRGEGLCHEQGLHQQVDVIMGTFSKSFGTYGAYVCADRTLIRYLVNRARSLIYTTGLPPMVIASVLQALPIVQEEEWRRERLKRHSVLLRSRLRELGFAVEAGDSPIIPLFIGDNQTALRFSQMLEERGIAAVAIRPPTVPVGTARIRFSLMATHTKEELEWVVEQVKEIAERLGVSGDATHHAVAERLGDA